ncbi:MAG: glycosyltransferase [Minisyncoccia bacterium]
MKQNFISVIAPVFNDAALIPDFVNRLARILREICDHYEILIIDDGSQDETGKVLDRILESVESVRYILLSKHYGEEIAIGVGLDTAIGEHVVIMKPGRDPVDLIPDFISELDRQCGIVFGVVVGSSRGFLVRMFARIFHWYSRKFLKLRLPKNSTTFIALTRTSVNALVKNRHIKHYIKLFYQNTGLPISEYPYKPDSPFLAESDSFFYKAKIGIEILMSHAQHPLRLVTYFNFFAIILNFILFAGLMISVFAGYQGFNGFILPLLLISFFLFFVFISIIFIAEYFGNIFNEMKGDKNYPVVIEKKSSILVPEALKDELNIERNLKI